jgi:hypothetical protein
VATPGNAIEPAYTETSPESKNLSCERKLLACAGSAIRKIASASERRRGSNVMLR